MQDYLDYVEVYDRCIVNSIIAKPANLRIFFDGFLVSCKNPRWICGENDPTNTELALSRETFPGGFLFGKAEKLFRPLVGGGRFSFLRLFPRLPSRSLAPFMARPLPGRAAGGP